MTDTTKKNQIKPKYSEKDILSLSFAGLTLFSLVIAVSTYLSAQSCSRLAKGAKATLIQQLDGEAFIANPKPANYRNPVMVRRYVGNWVAYTFSLTGELNVSGGQKISDQGLNLDGQQIPTNVISASYARAANKRKAFVQAYLQEGLVPEDYFYDAPTTKFVEIDSLGDAQVIDEKKQIYAVNVVATISEHQNGKPTGEVDFYRRQIIVASIPIPQQKPSANSNSIYQQLSYQWRKEGLQIQEINPLSFK